MTPNRFDAAKEVIERLLANQQPTILRAEAFFVARSGVLTLAYAGFPAGLVSLKRDLSKSIPDIPPENPGSRWPKTTLAVLRDGDTLTPDDVVALRASTADGSTCLARGLPRLEVTGIDLVELRCRSMEQFDRRHPYSLSGAASAVDPSIHNRVPAAERRFVNDVLSQWRRGGLSRYVPDLTRPGNRESHYRKSHNELVVVIPVGGRLPCIETFREIVEQRLPGRYVWFDADARHVTVRTLGSP